MGYYNTFVVKIWCDNCGQMVRGRVQHVHSQELLHFLDTKNMTDFMLQHLSPPTGEPAASGRPDTDVIPAGKNTGDTAKDG